MTFEPAAADAGASGAGGPEASGRRGEGLRELTLATAVAGAIGYLIVAAVPKVVGDPAQYLLFSAFWSGLYLVVAALSGLQQEVTRAARPAVAGVPRRGGLARFALAAGVAAGVAVAASSPLWARVAFGDYAWPFVGALAVAVVAYAGVAALSGTFYGLRLWRAIAATTIVDAVLRLVLVGVALVAGHHPAALAWAVALPFPLSLGVLWLLTRERVAGRYSLDAEPGRLAAHAAQAVGGAAALGVLASGLPMLIKLGTASEAQTAVAALVNTIMLTRAPLIVPVLALQGWLTLRFRDRADVLGSVVRTILVVLGATVVVAAVAYVLEPPILHAVWGAAFAVDGATCAGVILTAGLTAALCVSGPAALATARHGVYLVGWVLAAALTAGMLFAPLPLTPRVLLAMATGPVAGLLVHLAGLARPREGLARA